MSYISNINLINIPKETHKCLEKACFRLSAHYINCTYLQKYFTVQHMIVVCQKISSVWTIYKLFFLFSVHRHWKKSEFGTLWNSFIKFYIRKYITSKHILNWSWLLNLPWKYVFVRKKATANLRMESLSSFDRILDSKGSNDAKWSNSPFNRNLCRFEGLLLVSLFGSFGGGRKL